MSIGWWSAVRDNGGRCLLLALLFLSFQAAGGQEKDTKMEITGLKDTSVREGDNAQLQCKFSQTPDYVLWNYQTIGSTGYTVAAWCRYGRDCKAKPPFNTYSELSFGNGTLIFTGAKKRNDGIYTCHAMRDSSAMLSARLTVLVPPGKPELAINNSRPVVDQGVVLTCNSTGGNPAPELRWRWLRFDGTLRTDLKTQVSKTGGVFGTVVSQIAIPIKASDHMSSITCHASNNATAVSTGITSDLLRLEVRKLPGQPRISMSDSQPSEGTSLTISCTSEGGNPSPNISWTWTRKSGSRRELPNPTKIGPERPFGVVVSRLILPVEYVDNDAKVVCVVVNEVGAPAPAEQVLDVIYKPRIKPFHYAPYSVRENRRLEVPCVVEGNPSPTVRWTNNGARVLDVSGTSLSFSRLSRSHAGEYVCSADNSAGSTSHTLELRVLYPPTIKVSPTVVVSEGHVLKLNCGVYAYPKADVHWNGPDGKPVSMAGPMLRIQSITRQQSGRYECIAENRLVPSEGPSTRHSARNITQVIVHYKPGVPTITVHPSSSVEVKTSVVMICQANKVDPGNPAPILEWRRMSDSQILSQNGTYRLPQSELVDSGQYRCTPRNRRGEGPVRSVALQVEQKPEFIRELEPKRRTMKLTSLDIDFSIYCIVRGKPEPIIKWTRESAPIMDSPDFNYFYRVTSSMRPVRGNPKLGYEVKSILAWSGTKRAGERKTVLREEDNGNYACEAVNKRGTIKSTMNLVVEYPPQFVNPKYKVAANMESRVAKLLCIVSAQPAPSKTIWYLSDGTEAREDRDRRFNVFTEPPQPALRQYTTILTITELTERDLQFYRCHTQNSEGNNTMLVKLQAQSHPEVPTKLNAQSVTWESAYLTWVPGFDGGFRQTFKLGIEWSTSSDKRTAITGNSYNLTNLLPNTTYTVTIRGVNKLGIGVISRPATFTTENLFIPKIQDVRLNIVQKKVFFYAPPGYCVRVEVSRDRGNSWLPFRDCLSPTAEFERVSSTNEDYRAAVCLQRRRNVCSEYLQAIITEGGAEVPLVVILAVAVACAVLIVILFAILVFFCMRRRPRRKNFEGNSPQTQRLFPFTCGSDTIDSRRPQAVTINPYAPTPPSTGPAVQHHSPPMKPYAMVIPTSGIALHQAAPAYENGAASFGGDDTECARHRRGRTSPWDKEKRRGSPKPMGSTFGVPMGGDVSQTNVLSPPSNSSQDPLLTNSGVSPSDPPPYTDTIRRSPATASQRIELRPLGSCDAGGGIYTTWAAEPSSPISISTMSRSAVTSPTPSANTTIPLAYSSSTCPRQPKKVIYEVVV